MSLYVVFMGKNELIILKTILQYFLKKTLFAIEQHGFLNANTVPQFPKKPSETIGVIICWHSQWQTLDMLIIPHVNAAVTACNK